VAQPIDKFIRRAEAAYGLPITPVRHTGILQKSLHSEEKDMNYFEFEFARRFAALDHVKW
jgi:hypothetical protein